MHQVGIYIKKNLLGITIALCVCVFTYELLIVQSLDFTLTRYCIPWFIVVVVYTRYKENQDYQRKKNIKDKGHEE